MTPSTHRLVVNGAPVDVEAAGLVPLSRVLRGSAPSRRRARPPAPRNAWKLDAAAGLVVRAVEALDTRPGGS